MQTKDAIKPLRRSAHYMMRRNRPLYFLMAPALIYLLVFKYLPMLGTVIAFQDFRLTRPIWKCSFVGLDNFRKLFANPMFVKVVGNTVRISFLKLVIGFPAPILVALMLNEVRSNAFKRSLQTVMYMPHFLSWVVVGSLVFTFFAPSSGAFTQMWYQLFGVRLNIMMNPNSFIGLLVFSDIWKGVGWGSIVYLATLAGIDTSLYEAAYVDGANRWQQMRYITMPSLMSTIMTMLLLRVGHILNVGFEQIYVLQNDLVYAVSEVIDTFVYRVSFQQGQHAIGAAAGLFQSIIGLVFVLCTNALARKFDQEVI